MIKVVISGPESSGKSTLTMELSKHFSVPAVPEYARDYVVRLKRLYTFADVETIARRQIALYWMQERKSKDGDIIFFDTFLIITKVWFQQVYHCCPVWLHQAIIQLKPDLVLLCQPDIAWVADGVRENPNRREYLLECYQNELEYYGFRYTLINGFGPQRLSNAIRMVNEIVLYK